MKRYLKIIGLTILLSATSTWGREHTVQRGETFETIASSYGVTLKDLQSLNPKAKTCHVGMNLVIPDPPKVAEHVETELPKQPKQKKVDGWKIAGSILNFIGDVAQTYVQVKEEINSTSTNTYTSSTSAHQGHVHTIDGRPAEHLIAQNGKLTKSNNPDVVKRYQKRLPNCLIDIQCYKDGSRLETGYYMCKICGGTTICSVCNGTGRLVNDQLCSCGGSGKCSCAGPSGISFFRQKVLQRIIFRGGKLHSFIPTTRKVIELAIGTLPKKHVNETNN